MARFLRLLALVAALPFIGSARAKGDGSQPPDYRFEIRPILSKNCFPCHGPDEAHRQADLRLDVRDVAIDVGAIVPGAPEDSELVRRITSDDEDERMPPPESGHELTDDEIDVITRWIAAGAQYAGHWAYEPPQRPQRPSVSRPNWCRNEIDYFVLAQLDRAGLTPEPEADRHRLLRRVSLDLTGLPPTTEEVDQFVLDHRPDAYDRLVDRLLSSPAYGEHWAAKWLDLARYADTCGYEKDSRRTIWPFRDWVINALNADMPFDQFTIEQLAGDLLPEPTRDEIIATAFHRNAMQNDEGGADDEEYRVVAVIDRVNTTMQVWMGTTIGCCQCHSHKYDPLSQREYYELFAFFNQSADADRYDQEPTVCTPTEQQKELKAELDRRLEESRQAYDAKAETLATAQREWERAVRAEVDWQVLRPSDVTSAAGADCTLLDDGSVLVARAASDTERYTIRGRSELREITALRIEALPHESLPNDGPGRGQDGGFVLSKVEVFPEPIQPAENVKFVRVELPRHDYLTMAEVQVFRGDENVALHGTATQSSTAFEGGPELAIDGRTDPNFAMGRSISHTAFNDHPWWEVELPEPTRVDRVAIWNEEAHPDRLRGARVTLLKPSRVPVWQQTLLYSPDLTTTLTVDGASTPQIARAGADGQRRDYPANHAIEHHDPAQHGWSPDPAAKGPQAIVLGLDRPIVAEGPNRLRIVLDQEAAIDGRSGQTLGHFRVLVTDDAQAAIAATAPPRIRQIARTPRDERKPEQAEEIAKYFRSLRPELNQLVADREDVERRLTEEYRPDKTPIMKELPPAEQRKTHLFVRGSFLSPGEEVQPDTPEVFPPFADDLPRNRLGLAKWLVDRRNPLTARVAANRQWEQLFGTGIVLTSEDFGSQGSLPSHPELLDWLAVELMEDNWSLKELTRTIVESSAYRQSSRVSPEKLERDPDNRLISRGPRVRLSGEQVRDQALAVSGLLSRKMFGPSVMPYQPEGVWQVVYSDDRWDESTGEDRYRRGVYTFWRRTSPYPSAVALDAPSRETCTIRRILTNTPVAAFALLNDPVYVEAAQALARRIAAHAEGDATAGAEYAMEQVLARPPAPAEVERLAALFESLRGAYGDDASAANQMATSELGPADGSTPLAELAAWTVVSNVLLNLDETLTK